MNKAPGGTPDARKRMANQNAQEFVRGVWLELRRVTWPTREPEGQNLNVIRMRLGGNNGKHMRMLLRARERLLNAFGTARGRAAARPLA
jgi:hypothetical protein